MDCSLLCPWYFTGKNPGVGCSFLLWESSQLRDQTHISCITCIGRLVLYHQHHLGSPYFTGSSSVSPAPFIEEVFFFPLYILASFVKDKEFLYSKEIKPVNPKGNQPEYSSAGLMLPFCGLPGANIRDPTHDKAMREKT